MQRLPRRTVRVPLLALLLPLAGVWAGLCPEGVSAQQRSVTARDFARGVGGVMGQVFDSLRGAPLAGAEVVLLGTRFTGLTNAEGRFLIPNLPSGRYRIAFTHPRMDSLPFLPPPGEVEVAAGATRRVYLALSPSPEIREAAAVAEVVRTTLEDVGVGVDVRVRELIDASVGVPLPVRITGVVRDADSGRRIPEALVLLQGTRFRAVADGQGRFSLRDIPPGSYVLSAEMLGYATRFDDLVVSPGRSLEIDIPLATRPIELDPLEVEVRSLSLERTGFYDRRMDPLLQGTFLDRRQIDRRGVSEFADLFHEVPGARIEVRGMGDMRVLFARSAGSGGTGACEPQVYLDGVKAAAGPWTDLPPALLEAVEVYVGAVTPPQYSHPCGVVLVWTRRPV